jgi:hypothetical protein
MSVSIVFDPLLPPALVAIAAAIAAAVGVFALRRRSVLRLLAIGVLALALMNPSLVKQDREPLRDVVALVTDKSQSLDAGGRRAAADAAAQSVRDMVKADPTLELVEASAERGDDGTFFFDALYRALAEAPRRRLAAVVAVTDGQIHDAPRSTDAFDVDAPIHALIVGDRNAPDRRLEVRRAPPYAIVGERATFELVVHDPSVAPGTLAEVSISIDGGDPMPSFVPVEEPTPVTVDIKKRGPNVVEIEAKPGEHELTLANNRAAVSVSGVRDRLRVLLVTGEPHAGARAWRDLLKSDPSVDLVHFTILRPPDKTQTIDMRELSLIAFPVQELFEEKINQFDLIIFDHYKKRENVIQPIYLDNIASRVEDGGALLVVDGPPFAGPLSLYRTPLAKVLPARPTGQVIDGGFLPQLTDIGKRHPVTSALATTGDAQWGRWFRIIDATPVSADAKVLMSGPDNRPLVVLDRVKKGRVAEVLSDQTWLWARGVEGGGPHGELFRRLGHWLMQEPDLEEERLTAAAAEGKLHIERRTMGDAPGPATVTSPSGKEVDAPLAQAKPGDAAYTADVPIDEQGLYRIRSAGGKDGDLTAVAAAGPLNPRELADLTPTDAVLRPFVEKTHGGVFYVGEGDKLSLPTMRRTRGDADQAGRSWMGFRRNEAYATRSEERDPLAPALLAVALALGALTLAWAREGK